VEIEVYSQNSACSAASIIRSRIAHEGMHAGATRSKAEEKVAEEEGRAVARRALLASATAKRAPRPKLRLVQGQASSGQSASGYKC
jgi:hypothetical protein